MATGWFVAIAALWTGYFLLEGFDFGVGVLLRLLGRTDAERRTILATIGPVWDGNEVWVVTAIAATFGAFPAWYAGLLSSYYPVFLLILGALVLRAVAIEWRNKFELPARARWDTAIAGSSLALAALWGWLFAALSGESALLGAVVAVLLAVVHGARFLALKTTGDLRRRAVTTGWVVAALAVPALGIIAWPLLLAVVPLALARRDGWAFAASSVLVAAVAIGVFWRLHPAPLPGLTVQGAAASDYALSVLTAAAGFIAPFVLAYQAWSYWVFRQRVG